MIDNTLAEQTQRPNKFREPMAAPPSRASALHPSLGNQKVYSLDGSFSDIPSDAFKLEHRKEFRLRDENRAPVAKKDLSRHSHTHAVTHARKEEVDKVPESLIQTCLNYFQGRSRPKPSSLELILNICTELLDSDGLEEFALDDEKRQKMYDFRAEDGAAHHHHTPDGSVECACCPPGHHAALAGAEARERTHDDDEDEDVRSETIINDIFELFKPVGHRRDWMVINSQNPNER